MSSSKNSKTGVYLLVVNGLPDAYTWQDLKDFVRPETEHEFWAELITPPNGTGRKVGCIRTQRQKEAGKLYKYLACASVNGRRLAVVLWDISSSPPKQVAPSPGQTMSGPQARWAADVANGDVPWPYVGPFQRASHAGPAYPTQAAALAQSMQHPSLGPSQPQSAAFYGSQLPDQRIQALLQAQQQNARMQAACYEGQAQSTCGYDTARRQNGASTGKTAEYVSSQTGTPVNVRDGIAVVVSRGVFVSGLNYKAREDDVRRKFSSVGEVVRCMLHADPTTGKSKGYATMLFASPSEAQKAVDKYHQATWMEKKLHVRIDKEPTTVAAPSRSDASPLIVNGSRVH